MINLTGNVLPVRDLVAMARERGIETFVDGAHAFALDSNFERYARDYPGLCARDLEPKGVIERPSSDKGKTAPISPTRSQRKAAAGVRRTS